MICHVALSFYVRLFKPRPLYVIAINNHTKLVCSSTITQCFQKPFEPYSRICFQFAQCTSHPSKGNIYWKSSVQWQMCDGWSPAGCETGFMFRKVMERLAAVFRQGWYSTLYCTWTGPVKHHNYSSWLRNDMNVTSEREPVLYTPSVSLQIYSSDIFTFFGVQLWIASPLTVWLTLNIQLLNTFYQCKYSRVGLKL